jgi:hypothetical protein
MKLLLLLPSPSPPPSPRLLARDEAGSSVLACD